MTIHQYKHLWVSKSCSFWSKQREILRFLKILAKLFNVSIFISSCSLRVLYFFFGVETNSLFFFPCWQKTSWPKFMFLTFKGWNIVVRKPLTCCAGIRRTSQPLSDSCFNSIHSSCNMSARLAHASHACIMTRSNFTRFFHNNPKFMNYLVYSLRLFTFSFESAIFASRYFMKI